MVIVVALEAKEVKIVEVVVLKEVEEKVIDSYLLSLWGGKTFLKELLEIAW